MEGGPARAGGSGELVSVAVPLVSGGEQENILLTRGTPEHKHNTSLCHHTIVNEMVN